MDYKYTFGAKKVQYGGLPCAFLSTQFKLERALADSLNDKIQKQWRPSGRKDN